MKQPDVPQTLPALTEAQHAQLLHFQELALGFNTKLNLYSESSTEDFWGRHVLHSLALAIRPFPAGARVVDWGTGGGLPGLPLAVLFPSTEFVLIDSVGKKIRAVQTMVRRLLLGNVTTWHGRAEEWQGSATHSVSRATSRLTTLWEWHERVEQPGTQRETGCWAPGLYCLKGGELGEELTELTATSEPLQVSRFPLMSLLEDRFFEHKELVAVARKKNR